MNRDTRAELEGRTKRLEAQLAEMTKVAEEWMQDSADNNPKEGV